MSLPGMEMETASLDNMLATEGYRVLSPIGKGGFGGTFLAEDLRTSEQVVIKVVPTDRAARAQAEISGAGLAADLPPHPHIVKIVRPSKPIEGAFYYGMEPADNCHPNADPATNLPDGAHTLRHKIHRHEGVLAMEDAVGHALSILDALSHLRKSFLIHQDLKPSNLVFVNGVLKICDFSLVTGRPDPDAKPLQKEGTAPYGGDMHATAMMLYEMLGGKAQEPMTPTRHIPRGIWSVICRAAGGQFAGPWMQLINQSRCCERFHATERWRSDRVGFRCAMDIPASTPQK